jgi:hypothetical protein
MEISNSDETKANMPSRESTKTILREKVALGRTWEYFDAIRCSILFFFLSLSPSFQEMESKRRKTLFINCLLEQ